MLGEVSILNVGEGDTKLSFDKSNPAECIRAGRIVRDMLRRGYALLVEVDRDGEKKFQRVEEFDDEHGEYIIADFDPSGEQPPHVRREPKSYVTPPQYGSTPIPDDHPARSTNEPEESGEATASAAADVSGQSSATKGRRGRGKIRLSASTTRAVAVGRSAGG